MRKLTRLAIIVLSLALLSPVLSAQSYRYIVGVAHVDGKYNFTSQDFLNEGADALYYDLGARVIKVWLSGNPKKNYPFNSSYPSSPSSLVQVASTTHYHDLFAKGFTTFILEATTPTDTNFADGMTAAEIAYEKQQIGDLARYLIETYRYSGKTFVLQNWEGDWKLNGRTDSTAFNGMIDYLNARQDAVTEARAWGQQMGYTGVTVVHAAEVNLVKKAMQGYPTATNNVIPYTHCDLYSYSSWDLDKSDTAAYATALKSALSYLKAKAPSSELYGSNNVYLGEYGAHENLVGGPDRQLEIVQAATEAAVSWGVVYAIYWQIYCNEPFGTLSGRPTNDEMRGLWLIRPDGSKSLVWDYLQSKYTRRRGVRR